jgi:hypothetical protein
MIKEDLNNLERIISEVKSESGSETIILATSNKAVLRKIQIFANRPDIEILELCEYLVDQRNEICYILPKTEQSKIKEV